MKPLLLPLLLLCSLAAAAQSNQGKVSVKQSAEIDALVYGKKQQQPAAEKTKEQLKAEKKAAKKAEKEAKRQAKEEERQRKEAAKKGMVVNQQSKPEPVVVVTPKLPEQKVAPKKEVAIEEIHTAPRTKLVRRRVPVERREPKSVVYNGMKKTSGYRVQVFLGGNTREDKHRAEQAGHKVKAAYPTQPVYTHFHSPQWYCRVGNFVDYKKADALRQKIKALGFPQATVVKCTITVRNIESVRY